MRQCEGIWKTKHALAAQAKILHVTIAALVERRDEKMMMGLRLRQSLYGMQVTTNLTRTFQWGETKWQCGLRLGFW